MKFDPYKSIIYICNIKFINNPVYLKEKIVYLLINFFSNTDLNMSMKSLYQLFILLM